MHTNHRPIRRASLDASEEGILDEIEWATDEISDDQWSSVDLDAEKLQDFEINLISE